MLSAIERLRQPADSKNDEEQIIRGGPEKAGLMNYLGSIKRINKALADMEASNLRSTQQTANDLRRLVSSGQTQLEAYFDKLLRAETPRSVEPLHFITKDKPFPVLSPDLTHRLGVINSYVGGLHRQKSTGATPHVSSIAKTYAEARSPYLLNTLDTLAAGSTNTAKKVNPDAIYRAGTNGIGMYAKAMEGLFVAEHESLCQIFLREDWGPVFQQTCQSALLELTRTLRVLDSHIKTHMHTDCYLAYETIYIVSSLSNNLESRTGELKANLAASLKPIRDTARTSLHELLDDTRHKIGSLQVLPTDGGPIPLVSETMLRLQGMVEFLRPLSTILISLGDGGWNSSTATRGVGDGVPSLASFDVAADGKQIFAHYCADTVESLLVALDGRARAVLQKKAVSGVFLANSVAIVDRMVRESDLAPLLEGRLGVLDQWRKKATGLYTETCREISSHLFDVTYTGRGGGVRPQSGTSAVDSASIVKNLSSKERESIKAKFTAFNASFDDMVTRHRQYSMEKEVRLLFARDMQHMIEPLYNRFWDRYHEIDKGKGKYVKYDKAAIAAVFNGLY